MDGNKVIEDSCWYQESWTDEDLEIALSDAEIEITDENVAILKQECLYIFDDKSIRNEILADKARSVFRMR